MNGDGNAIDKVKAFQSISSTSASKAAHHLVLGNWGHPATPQTVPVIEKMANRWFSHYLKGDPLGPDPRVRFVKDEDPATGDFEEGKEFPLRQWKSGCLYIEDDRLLSSAPKGTSKQTIAVSGTVNYQELTEEKPISANSIGIIRLFKRFDSPITLVGMINVTVFAKTEAPQADLVLLVRQKKANNAIKTFGMAAQKIFSGASPQRLEFEIGPALSSFEAGDEIEIVFSGSLFPVLVPNTLSPTQMYFDEYSEGKIELVSSEQFPGKLVFYFRDDGSVFKKEI